MRSTSRELRRCGQKHHSRRDWTIGVSCVVLLLAAPVSASAADAPNFFRESFSLNKDDTALRRLDDVREYIRTNRWDQAADLLIQLSQERGRSLVPIRPGWYVSVSQRCNLLVMSLPADGRAAYRRKIDARAAKWLQDGLKAHEESLLQRVVRDAFGSSSGDDALLTLGQWAWDQGDIATARLCWRRMLPPEKPAGDEPAATGELRYPDTNHDVAAIRARLILCDVMAGRRDRAETAFAEFRKQHATAAGRLAGRTGAFVDSLAAVLNEAASWKPAESNAAWTTFAGASSRQHAIRNRFEVGRPRWSRPLFPPAITTNADERPFPHRREPATFPVITNGRVYIADAGRVFGYESADGSPAFSPQAKAGTTGFDERAVLFSLDGNGKLPAPFERTTGRPWFTLTTNGDKLYARLGSPITGRAKDETRAVRSSLICLDLKHGEGKIVWKNDATAIGAGWEFDGVPIVSGERIFVVLRRRNPETEIHVACFDAERGRRLWTTPIGTAIAAGAEEANHVSHLLLTLAAGRLYLSTDLGVLAALDTRDGFLEWLVTYRSRNAERGGKRETHDASHLTPCVVHDGRLFVAPSDSDRLLALDAQTGQPAWQRALRGDVRHLLGVLGGRLVVSGERLWGLDPQRGTVAWTVGYENPAGFGFGRGTMAGENVYWPLRNELLVVEAKSGRLQRRIRLKELHGRGGGNLSFVDGTLLIAEPNRLTAYDTRPVKPK